MIIVMVLNRTFRKEVDNKMYEILNPKKYITVVKIPLSSIKKIDLVMAKQPLEKIQDCFNRFGSFGAATEKAVKEFQKQNGLVVDGIVGEKTWGSLLNK